MFTPQPIKYFGPFPTSSPLALYRSGEYLDDVDMLIKIRQLGIRTIISLERHRQVDEAIYTYIAGIRLIHLPLSQITPPTYAEKRLVMAYLNDTSLHPILLHCKEGKDRTGVMAATHRIWYQGWTRKQAIQEMINLSSRFRLLAWWRWTVK